MFMIKDQSECENTHSNNQKIHESSTTTEISSSRCHEKSNNLTSEDDFKHVNSQCVNSEHVNSGPIICESTLFEPIISESVNFDTTSINCSITEPRRVYNTELYNTELTNESIQNHINNQKCTSASFYRSNIIGCGSYLPEKIVTNADLERTLDTNNQWIIERTGIEQRRVASSDQNTSDLAFEAAKMAIQNSGINMNSIDMIIVATTTPDHTFPATSTLVQKKLGIKSCISFDMQAVCSGFIFALTTADMYIKTGMIKTALVIGAETLSRIIDPNDRSTAILFADGAGAFILQSDACNSIISSQFSKKLLQSLNKNAALSSEIDSNTSNSFGMPTPAKTPPSSNTFIDSIVTSNANTSNINNTDNADNTNNPTANFTRKKSDKDCIPSGIIESVLHTDGAGYDLLKTSGGPSSGNGPGVILMEGQSVFKRAVEELSSVISELLDKTPFESKDIDWFIPHQANKRIIYAAAKAIGLDESKIIYTGNKHANTSAASVPLAFHEAFKSGLIKFGDIVLFESFGAGFSWGATLVKL